MQNFNGPQFATSAFERTMTADEMAARIAQLEAELAQPARKAVSLKRGEAGYESQRVTRKAAKQAEKARKAQFKLEAFKRARLHCTINRYKC